MIVNLNPTHKRLEGRRNGCCREWQNVEEIVPNFDPFAVARVWSKAENSAQRFGERERERERTKFHRDSMVWKREWSETLEAAQRDSML